MANLEQEDVPMMVVTAQNLRLLPSDSSLENIESRMTSVSLGQGKGKQAEKGVVATKPGASLTNLLKQALQSDDSEQLDWIISQKDSALVESTLAQLTEESAITAFFKLVLNKFQQEKSVGDQLAVLLWLKTLLRLHWPRIVQSANVQDLSSLAQIQSYIQKKTATMSKLQTLRGKLEMAKRTIQLQQSTRQVETQEQKST